MIWLLRAASVALLLLIRSVSVALLLVMGSGYVLIGCMVLMSDCIGWMLHPVDRVLEELAQWGESL